jgi:hypothetical protein
MTVFLKAGSELRTRLRPDIDDYTRRVETEPGKTVRDIGLDPAFVAFIFVEGKVRNLDFVPAEGQSITLQPPVSGG